MCCHKVGIQFNGYQLMELGGYCANPSCAGTEFLYNIIAEWSGQGTGYTKNVGQVLADGEPFPRSRDQVETKLLNADSSGLDSCKRLYEALHNETYAILPGPLLYSYFPAALTRTTTSTTTTSTTSTTTSTTQTATTTTSTTS